MTTRDDDDVDLELLGRMMDALPAEKPAPALKDRLMKSIAAESRFARFTAAVARIIDVAHDQAEKLVNAIDDATRWESGLLPGTSLYHIDGGPAVAGAIVGFTRMEAGAVFPEHKHVGEETVLVIQGGFIDSSGAVHRAGDEVHMAAGTTHSFTAAPGPDLVYLGVVLEGFDIGEAHFGPSEL